MDVKQNSPAHIAGLKVCIHTLPGAIYYVPAVRFDCFKPLLYIPNWRVLWFVGLWREEW